MKMFKYSRRYSQASILKARRLRGESTKAERKLWSLLRGNQLSVHFRRQVPIGPYVVDFISSRAKLIVELDGSQHYSEKMVIKDSRRTFFLQQEGYKVLRFNNVEVFKNPEGVAETILKVYSVRVVRFLERTPP